MCENDAVGQHPQLLEQEAEQHDKQHCPQERLGKRDNVAVDFFDFSLVLERLLFLQQLHRMPFAHTADTAQWRRRSHACRSIDVH